MLFLNIVEKKIILFSDVLLRDARCTLSGAERIDPRASHISDNVVSRAFIMPAGTCCNMVRGCEIAFFEVLAARWPVVKATWLFPRTVRWRVVDLLLFTPEIVFSCKQFLF